MEKLRHGIIGLGFFGEKHAEVFSNVSPVELTAICTRRPGRLKEVGNRFNVPKRYTDYRDLLADPEIDSVSIVTHIDDHRDITIAALNSGKHVFLEKPMAGNAGDCDAMITAAKNARGIFFIGHICRFDTRIALAKKAIAENRLGKIVTMCAKRNLPKNISAETLDKISPLMGDGIHDTDLMLWFSQSRVKSVYARNVRIRDFAYPDIGWAMLNFEDDSLGVIETAWYLPENTPYAIDAKMEIIGTAGALSIDCGNAGLSINDANGISLPDTRYWPDLFGQRTGALRDEISYFVSCALTGSQPEIITPEESRMAVAVMSAAEESAASGKVVEL